MQLELFPTLDFAVSLTFLVKIPAGSSGYVISKSTRSGSRYFGIWVGPTTAKVLVFFYRKKGTSDTQHSVAWPILVADGTMHEINLVVDETTAELSVPTLGYSGEESLDGTLDDCGGGVDDDDGDCITYLGRRAGSFSPSSRSTCIYRGVMNMSTTSYPETTTTTATATTTTTATTSTTTATVTTTTVAPATTTTAAEPAAINMGRIGIAAYSLLDDQNANIEGGGVEFNSDGDGTLFGGNGGFDLHALPPPTTDSTRGWTIAAEIEQAAGSYGYLFAKSAAPSVSGRSWLRHYALYSSKSRGLVFYYRYTDSGGSGSSVSKATLNVGVGSKVNDGNRHRVVLAVAPADDDGSGAGSVSMTVTVDGRIVFSGDLQGSVTDCSQDDDNDGGGGGGDCIFDVGQRRNAAGKGTARFKGRMYTANILPDKEVRGFPSVSTRADNRGTAVDWLADGNHNPAGFPQAAGGGYVFRGDRGMPILAAAQTVASRQWSMALKFRSQGAGSGYLFAKSTSSGITRYRSLYLSSSRQDVAFYYQTVSSSTGGNAKRRSIRFPINLGDGAEYSIVLTATLRSDGAQAMSLFVDDVRIGPAQLLPSGTELNDCASCTLYLGQRASSSGNHYRFKGAVHEARFVDRVALSAYPAV